MDTTIFFHARDATSFAWQRLRAIPTSFGNSAARSHLGRELKITRAETIDAIVRKSIGEAFSQMKAKVSDATTAASKALPAILGLSPAADVMNGIDAKALRAGSSNEVRKQSWQLMSCYKPYRIAVAEGSTGVSCCRYLAYANTSSSYCNSKNNKL
eukprot:867781-Amphidinium_carterae.1